MMRLKRIFLNLIILLPFQVSSQGKYTADNESLSAHPLPAWYTKAKFGIMIHWGVYSVPAWKPLEEGWQGSNAAWYGPDVLYKPWRSDDFHARNYGNDVGYRELGPMFRAELWNPSDWATLIKYTGAGYAIITAKHHDGYCMWDTPDPYAENWNSMDVGPRRNIIGEFSQAVRQQGLKFGILYSLMEWETTQTTWPFDPQYAAERTGYYVPQPIWEEYHLDEYEYTNHIHAQLKDLVERYNPEIIYAYGDWDKPDSLWESQEFISWFYNTATNRKNILVNDRWGNNTAGLMGDVYISENGFISEDPGHAWEEWVTMSNSYALNREEQPIHYKSAGEIITSLCQTVCKGGNFVLNVSAGPDGIIPLNQQETLLAIGRWMEKNNKAILNSEPLSIPGSEHSFTRNGKYIYAFQYGWSKGSIKIRLQEDYIIKNCNLLGYDSKLVWKQQGPDLLIFPPGLSPDNTQLGHVYVYQIELELN